MATSQNISSLLSNINSGLTIATTVEGVLVPIVTGIVNNIKAKTVGDTVTFDIELQAGMDNLTEVHSNVKSMLDAINAERAKAVPPLPPITVQD